MRNSSLLAQGRLIGGVNGDCNKYPNQRCPAELSLENPDNWVYAAFGKLFPSFFILQRTTHPYDTLVPSPSFGCQSACCSISKDTNGVLCKMIGEYFSQACDRTIRHDFQPADAKIQQVDARLPDKIPANILKEMKPSSEK